MNSRVTKLADFLTSKKLPKRPLRDNSSQISSIKANYWIDVQRIKTVENEQDEEMPTNLSILSIKTKQTLNSRPNTSKPAAILKEYRADVQRNNLSYGASKNYNQRLCNKISIEELQALEAKQQVEQMHQDIAYNLRKLDTGIQSLQYNIQRIIEKQITRLQHQVVSIVQQVFEVSRNWLRQSYRDEEQNTNFSLYAAREQIQKLECYLETLKNDLEGNEWRKVTKQFLSSGLEVKVKQALDRVATIRVSENIELHFSQNQETEFRGALKRLLSLKPVNQTKFNHRLSKLKT